jgi:hypothetical protein
VLPLAGGREISRGLSAARSGPLRSGAKVAAKVRIVLAAVARTPPRHLCLPERAPFPRSTMLATPWAGDRAAGYRRAPCAARRSPLGLAECHEGPRHQAPGQLVLGPLDLARLIDGFLGHPGRFGMVPFRHGDLGFCFRRPAIESVTITTRVGGRSGWAVKPGPNAQRYRVALRERWPAAG